jgi:hypothetical protein
VPRPGPGASSGSCRGWVPFVPPGRRRPRHCRPAWGRVGTVLPGEGVDVHGKQNGSVYQEVTLGRGDVAPASPLAEDRACLLECCLYCKHGNHSPHLQLRYTARGAGRGRGFGPAWALGFHGASTASAGPIAHRRGSGAPAGAVGGCVPLRAHRYTRAGPDGAGLPALGAQPAGRMRAWRRQVWGPGPRPCRHPGQSPGKPSTEPARAGLLAARPAPSRSDGRARIRGQAQGMRQCRCWPCPPLPAGRVLGSGRSAARQR